MNFVKKNFKLIIGIIIGAILISGISVYATGQYLASQVDYNKNGQAKVSDALDDLYSKVPSGTENIIANGTYDISKKANVNVNVTVAGTKTLLWTNSSLNANFVSDEISMTSSITNYTHILIQWKQNVSSSTIYEDICKTSPNRLSTATGYFTIGENDNDGYFIRNILWDTQGKLTIANAVNIAGTGVNNSKLIPIAIYGLNISY